MCVYTFHNDSVTIYYRIRKQSWHLGLGRLLIEPIIRVIHLNRQRKIGEGSATMTSVDIHTK